MQLFKILIVNQLRFLFFRSMNTDEFLKHFRAFWVFGLTATVVAGIGRYWDNPRAEIWQYMGLGSLAYILVLALILWLLVLPLKPQNWTYINVLTFLGLTSAPAFLYAIPVERFMSLSSAQLANVWFLAIVAIWRVALLYRFLTTAAKLSGFTAFIALLLPLVLIVSSLTLLNLEHVIFRIMAGLQEHERSQNDAAYGVLFVITALSVYAFPVFLVLYLGKIIALRYKPQKPV